MKKGRIVKIFFTVMLLMIWLNNTTLFHQTPKNSYKILAHRGLAQTYDIRKVNNDTNTAKIIDTPTHPYLENTIPAIERAFELGADVVELDVKLTKDKILAVFHDSNLQFRTNVNGEIGDYSMSELRKVDIGYGYTSDDGKTFPFRGKGIGLMPSLDEILKRFSGKNLLIHIKDGNIETYKVLINYLSLLSDNELNFITVYGDDDGIDFLRSENRSLRLLSMKMMKKSLLQYELIGFTGYVPKELHNMELHLPLNYAKLLWGWPNKFIERMELVNTRVVIVEGDGQKSTVMFL